MPIRALVLRAAGVNCDIETARAFELAGAVVERIHINQIIQTPALLDRFQVLALSGGFSYGDDVSAGKVLALQLSPGLTEAMREFVNRKKLIVGICNGFQVLIKAELLPGPTGSAQSVTLGGNVDGRFHCRWLGLRVRSKKCVWTSGLTQIELPIAHGEGRFIPADDSVRERLWQEDQVALTYDENINGSIDAIAALCDASGLVFGLMPHPERFVWSWQHYAWASQSQSTPGEMGQGLAIFQNAVRWFE